MGVIQAVGVAMFAAGMAYPEQILIQRTEARRAAYPPTHGRADPRRRVLRGDRHLLILASRLLRANNSTGVMTRWLLRRRAYLAR